jgi:hypothetical protein
VLCHAGFCRSPFAIPIWKTILLNDNYKEVKQKFAEEFGDKARFPWLMKKIRSVLKDNTTYYCEERTLRI